MSGRVATVSLVAIPHQAAATPAPNQAPDQAAPSSVPRMNPYSASRYRRPASDSVRWMTYVTDSVCSGCTSQSNAVAKPTVTAAARNPSGIPARASVRRTTPNNTRPTATWISRLTT